MNKLPLYSKLTVSPCKSQMSITVSDKPLKVSDDTEVSLFRELNAGVSPSATIAMEFSQLYTPSH